MRVGVLGVGLMGAAMSRRLLSQGFDVTAWDRHRERAQALEPHGGRSAAQPADVVREADVVLTMLRDADVLTDIVRPLLPAWRPETSWLQCGTIGAGETDRLVALARDHQRRHVRHTGLRKHPAGRAG
ncbi:NAD(P)-binding domain-containing protein [Actinopolymorpha pittospori]|uniref:3-hydroxyisobutyrate dehydrogenase-like beta-hydroxyacid dehydrogenase n=1 Tax=Actinopolymorpha pittospori TaxID=648752 RepID=A0A927RDE9_9ACTN|nr:NAD(P)-binding domain-containing protein [Actinopolymorpha pittospori]MBE1608070.1 3-hydroxyisobutyrate dehydrogenase-like beta-hydroxyacid dehydrogenase [Actinopolymorpha pittospori]